MNILEQTINRLELSDPITHRNLRITFLSDPQQKTNGSISNWDESLGLEISELDTPVVNELIFRNNGTTPVFVPDSAVIVGLKQNRSPRMSFLIGATTSVLAPVVCIQAGRWHYQDTQESVPYHVYSRLRAINLRNMNESLRSQQDNREDTSDYQQQTWNEIKRAKAIREQQAGRIIDSPSEFIGDIYTSEQETIEDFVQSLEYNEETLGYCAEIDGRVVVLELFGTTKLFERNFNGLVAGLSLEATDNQFRRELQQRRPLTVRSLLRSIEISDKQYSKSIGLGTDCRFETPVLTGAGIMDDSRLYHLEVFTY